MKKLLILFLALVMALSMAACGKKEEPAQTETKTMEEVKKPETPDKPVEGGKEPEVAAPSGEEEKEPEVAAKPEEGEKKPEEAKKTEEGNGAGEEVTLEDASTLTEEPTHKVDMNEVNEILRIINEPFEGLGVFEFNEEHNAFLFFSKDDGFNEGIEILADNPNHKELQDSWKIFADSIKDLSTAIKEEYTPGYSVIIMNPFNSENMLLMVSDGVEYYNAFGQD